MATKKPSLSLKGRALAWLAQREHSEAEMRRKLLRALRSEREAARQAGAAGSGGVMGAERAQAADADRSAPGDSVPQDSEGCAEQAAARADEVLAWLRAHHYLSEERFVESRIHARAARYGNRRIQQELAQHGAALSADAADALKHSEFDRALEVWRRKFGTPASDAAGRARQTRFLLQRGFSGDTVSRVLRAAAGGRDREDD